MGFAALSPSYEDLPVIRHFTVATLLLLTLGGAAEAQQKLSTGGTCSGHRSRCDTACRGKPAKIPNCMAGCTNMFNSCMQTGIWDGPFYKFTEVQRQ